jgi:hypothetical protein
MATAAPRTSAAVPREEFEPSGWVTFAAIVLFIGGFFGAMWGLAGILNDEVVSVGGKGVIVWDFTAWGWAHLVIGCVMMAASFALFAGRGWARWLAVAVATLSAVAQIGSISAFPLYALAVLALDITVIYQLTARWSPAAR